MGTLLAPSVGAPDAFYDPPGSIAGNNWVLKATPAHAGEALPERRRQPRLRAHRRLIPAESGYFRE
ncbi:MAG TPA: hypothetical protein VGK73_05500, partial [Polyangiaceae bacterium]